MGIKRDERKDGRPLDLDIRQWKTKYYPKPSGTIDDEKSAACVIHARSSMTAFLGIQSPLELNIGSTIDLTARV